MLMMRSLNTCESLKGYIASDMRRMPSIITPKPKMMDATSFLLLALVKSIITVPKNKNKGIILSTFKDTKNAVVVVPMLAPMMTPVA